MLQESELVNESMNIKTLLKCRRKEERGNNEKYRGKDGS